MVNGTRFTGTGTALVTPFRHDRTLDERALHGLIQRQIDAGIDFLVPCGTTGESPTLMHEEHLRVVEIAVKLAKSCNDLRLLSSGPRAGLGEINLPPVQAGSSIMPGKVNPVIPEVVNQVAFEVIGNDVTITMAAEAGQLQLNAFEPVILHSLAQSITHLSAACLTLAERCVVGITANTEALLRTVENSIGLVAALNPHIGYMAATDIAKEALASGRGIVELVLEKGLLPSDTLIALLRPEVVAGAAQVSV